MTRDQMITHLRAADAVARHAVAHGHHPFGAVLVGPDDAILMRQGNIDTVHHAETELARRAAAFYPQEFLWTCTLVSNRYRLYPRIFLIAPRHILHHVR
jgi:tRNA(Arg) A34 adenosine deaminase TadA